MQHPSQRKEIPSPPAITASCRKKRQQLENKNAQDLLISRRLKLTCLTEDTGTPMERARLGSPCSRVLVVLIFALKQDIAKLKQSACCQRYANRLEICQQIYTTRFSGQKIYTLKVRKLQLFLLKKKQRKCINISYLSRLFVKI